MGQMHNFASQWQIPAGHTKRQYDWDGLFMNDAEIGLPAGESWKLLPQPWAEAFEIVARRFRQLTGVWVVDEKGAAPVVGPTDVRFPVDGKTIVLVDDVLYTGRTVRAALDELVDFGRPRRVWLLVLVDRGGRELPIAADFVGARLQAAPQDDVQVKLREAGAAEDAVVVTRRAS